MTIHPTAIIGERVAIPDNVVVNAYVVIGGEPQDLKFKGERSYLEIGDDNVIREFCTFHRANGEGETTRIGSRNFFMVGVHVAHNCIIGDDNRSEEHTSELQSPCNLVC